jgi:cysteinyl-tRNA synthetase
MLRTHYRQPIDWTMKGLEESRTTLLSWANVLERHKTSFDTKGEPETHVLAALLDDLNTPMALALMHKLADQARKGDFISAQALHSTGEFLGVITRGLMSSADNSAASGAALQLMPQQFQKTVHSLVEARNSARKAKDFREADRIREKLAEMGIRLKDNADGTTTPEIAR